MLISNPHKRITGFTVINSAITHRKQTIIAQCRQFTFESKIGNNNLLRFCKPKWATDGRIRRSKFCKEAAYTQCVFGYERSRKVTKFSNISILPSLPNWDASIAIEDGNFCSQELRCCTSINLKTPTYSRTYVKLSVPKFCCLVFLTTSRRNSLIVCTSSGSLTSRGSFTHERDSPRHSAFPKFEGSDKAPELVDSPEKYSISYCNSFLLLGRLLGSLHTRQPQSFPTFHAGKSWAGVGLYA